MSVSHVSDNDTAPTEAVDEAGLDSFPASDPPSWTLGAEETFVESVKALKIKHSKPGNER